MTAATSAAPFCQKIVRTSEWPITMAAFNESVKGNEENITAQLQLILSRQLSLAIMEQLDDYEKNNVKFDVHLYSKSIEEPVIGADLVCRLKIMRGGRSIEKAFLVQSKVANRLHNGFSFGDSNLQEEINKMLCVTSDSFVFVYSDQGIIVIPAFEIALSGKRTIRTAEVYYRNISNFYGDFFRCFIGDQWLYRHYKPALLNDLNEEKILNVQHILDFKIDISENE